MENKEDLKKYFDSEQYITTIVGNDKTKTPEENKDKITTLISLLTDVTNKPVKEETLLTLKKENAGEILLQAIARPESKKIRHILVAACWESEINFSKYIPFFILLVLDPDYFISLEAITTIENMEGPFIKEDLKAGIKTIKAHQKKVNTEQVVLLNDLVMTLESFINKEETT